ncbi:hypothetical protein NFC79_21125 (plasmid) [Providencia stuartii]|nr:hypothetical protein NFC79_21125 [Providencia stuartii]
MQDNILTATQTYQLFFECVAACIDSKEEGIKRGILQEDIPSYREIPSLIVLNLWDKGYDTRISPSMMYAFLLIYAMDEMSEYFLFYYQQFSLKAHGVKVSDDISNVTLYPFIDMDEFAETSKELGYKKHWGEFLKDPFKTQWDNVFNGISGKKTHNVIIQFILNLYKKDKL